MLRGMKLISITFLLLSFQFSKELEIIDIFRDIFNPSGLIFQIFKLKFLQEEESFSCTLCKRLVTAVRTTIEEKYSPDEIIYILSLLCSLNSDYEYCYSFLSNYLTPLFKNGFARLTNSENFCHTLGLCPEGQITEDAYDYAIRVLKDKPNKQKEAIDPSGARLKMVQVTDIHYDQRYKQNASIYCGTPLCCHEPASNYSRIKSGLFGSIENCDTNINTLKSFIDAAYDLEPDLIIWSGDNTEHDNWNSTQEEVYEATRTIKNAFDEKFQHKIPIYPAIGNHENYPNDLWEPGNYEIFKNLADIYKDYFFEEQAYESFSKFGYYTMLHPNSSLRIVALNCLYCDSMNFNLLGKSYTEAKQEFQWLEEVLRQAEKNNEYVYIIDHFPINGRFTLNECSLRLRALFDRFDYIIRGYFSGHNHNEDITPVRTYFEPRPIININYIAPSLTTHRGVNPSFRQYIIDNTTKNIIDYEQYRLNLTDANLNLKANWTLSHKATQLFNVSDLTERDKMCSIDVEGLYIQKRYCDNVDEKKTHDKKEIKKAKCMITTDSYHDFFVCSEQTIFSDAYYYSLINDISGEWPL